MSIGQEREIKNLLIIGHTKVGKSTLCNVLCDNNYLDENENTVRKSEVFSEQVFVWKETKYRVFEIEVSSIRKILSNRKDEMQKGVCHVLFLVDERFTAEDVELFKKEIFNTGIVKYTTIVRTKFENFKDEKRCEEDKRLMLDKIGKSCRDIIYVDNPPTNIDIEDDDDKERVENHKKTRSKSRNILLNHLETAYPLTQQTTEHKSRKKGQKDQQWFNEKYSKLEDIDFTGSRRLNFTGSFKIEDFKTLESINLKKLKLTSLEIRNCSQLKVTNLSEHSKLTSLSVTGCPKLSTLNCSSNALTSLEIRNCSQLIVANLFEHSKLTSLSVTGCPELNMLNCSSNGLTSLEISGCSQLNKINLSKFTKLKSLYLRGYQKLTTLDCSSIVKLTILKISCCTQLTDIKSSKVEKLSVIDCPKLTTLEYSTNALTSLELSSCKQLNKITNLSNAPKLTSLTMINCQNITELNCSSAEKLTELEVRGLTKLNCSNTSIKILSINLCPNIKELNCSNIKELVNLDISNCSELEFLDCSNSKLTSLDITNCSKLKFLDCSNSNLTGLDVSNCKTLLKEFNQNGTNSENFKYPLNLKLIQRRPTKNLIIVGCTGSGKSALSNVLTGTDEFFESGNSFSVTKNLQKQEFEWKGKYFNVIDTIGVGNTQLSTKNVLHKVSDGIFSIPEGISQILFVIDRRFTADEAKNFNLIKSSIYDIFKIHILDYVTIVRTKFSNFKSEDKCKADKEQLHNENDIIAEIVKSCRDVIYVDNPPIDIEINEDEDEQTVKTNKRIRKKSREVLLNYLDKVCQLDYFKLEKWDEVRDDVAKYLESEYDDLSPVLEKNKEILTLVKISESYCSIS